MNSQKGPDRRDRLLIQIKVDGPVIKCQDTEQNKEGVAQGTEMDMIVFSKRGCSNDGKDIYRQVRSRSREKKTYKERCQIIE